MKRNNKKGFTIVELVIVIAVIGILAAVLIPTFSGIIESAQDNAGKQEARNGYLECYAEDIADGVADAKIGTTDMTNTNYTVDGTGTVYTHTDNNGKTYTYNGSVYGGTGLED